ncbi:histidine kinase [Paenibacillus favisporus]|uniref:sensor histidine kinase n=1 Tax=Paenibacillus TaxID=44249 RepID=UPI0011A63B8D|nr:MULTISPECIES: histidine kinase [Paenibacillus]MBJ9993067.1 histidine kinase [Paenibacillus sp. S28]MEC0179363.1 histidine kinase [Paenibacillus favisporus]
MPRNTLFRKMVLLLVMMLVPIVGLYFYSNRTSTEVLGTELSQSSANQLNFFQTQVNTNIERFSLWPTLLIQDPDIFGFKDVFLNSEYFNLDMINLVKRIQTKLNIQESSSDWKTKLYIFSPSLGRMVSDNDVESYDNDDLKKRMRPGWQVKKMGEGDEAYYSFSLFTAYPYSSFSHPEDANLIIELQFDSSNIQNMLDKFKSDGRRDPIYYRPDMGVIYNRSADRPLTDSILRQLRQEPLKKAENRRLELDGETYLVNIAASDTTGWYLIDYVPLKEIVAPIEQSNRLFYVSVGLTLLLSCLAAYMLYAQVQVPVKRLVLAFKKLQHEDYSVRLEAKGNNEFGFVFQRFNSMVGQIQELFENVYMERIHVREARLKQLQSQINPHFFYNCFSFISSMAKLGNMKAVVAMAHNLSNYYRYTTRQERDVVPLQEELDFVRSYLEIQKMRKPQLEFAVDIPEVMRKWEVPLLVVQPLVENAVLHGIEPKSGAGSVRIAGEVGPGEMRIIVEDGGRGMTEEQMEGLRRSLTLPMSQDMGCGLWNVRQRMLIHYGDTAGLRFAKSGLGGVRVELHWPIEHTLIRTGSR